MTAVPSRDEMVEFNRALIDEYRQNGGKVSGPFAGAPLLLLTTTGAKSGRELTSPLAFTRDGDRIIVIASKAGAPTNPAWYHNLVANPDVKVELDDDTFDARAEVTEGDERERLYRQQAEVLPPFNQYEKNTTRQIPVIALNRKG